MESIIELKDLTFSYREGTQTLDHVSISFPKGKRTAIIGQNGSGKSTITKLLIGLLEAKSGEIVVDGITLSEDTIYDIRDRIGIVFQNPDNQFIGSTVRDDIAFGLENMCVDPQDMDDIINDFAKKVNMFEFLDSEPTKLSGGQKQRVAIAGILALKPKIIILDEATSMLDPKGKKEINQLVDEIAKEHHLSIITITHDLEEAAQCDYVVLMGKGKVIDSGTPESILSQKSLLESLRLDVPFGYKISSLLKDQYNIEPTIHSEEVVNALCQLHSTK